MNNRNLHPKRALRAALFVLLLSVAGMTKVYAVTIGDLNYSLNSSTLTATVTGHKDGTSATGNLIIPSSVTYGVRTYSVTSVGDYAFEYCSGLTSFELPNSVTSIGEGAFVNCESLTSINIPNSVTFIGDYAFQGCSGLTSIELPNSVTSIAEGVFDYCGGLTSIVIPNSVTSIGDYAFEYCTGLTSMTVLAENPPTLGIRVFFDVSRSILVFVPSGSIEAYQSANGWNEFAHIHEIGPFITFADANVKALCVANWDTNGDGELSYAEAAAVTSLGEVFRNQPSITSFNELQCFTELTSIGSYAFSGCTGLTSIEIPNSVTSIGYNAFTGCRGLFSIEIPNSVTSIGQYAFYGCNGLTSIEFPNSARYIGDYVLYQCYGLTSMTVLATYPPSLGNSAFEGMNKNILLYVPCGSEEFYQDYYGWNEFSNIVGLCSGEVEVMVNPSEGGTITGADYYESGDLCVLTATPNPNFSFANWTENGVVVSTNTVYAFHAHPTTIVANFCIDDNIEFADTIVKALCVYNWDINDDGELSYAEAAAVTSLGTVFNNSSITSFDELQYFVSLTSIGNFTFYQCTSLTSIEIPNSVAYITSSAFEYCTSLTSIEIPNSVTYIGSHAFAYCTSLTSIEIPNSVTSIDLLAFSYCTSLTSIEIPNSVTYIGKNPFAVCDLRQIIVDEGNTAYDSRDNCNAIINSSTDELITGCKNTVIPTSVTSIGNAAFAVCTGLTSIEIPNSVTSIGIEAFGRCTSLTSIEIPISVTSIGAGAFHHCTGLTLITVWADTPPTLGVDYVFNMNVFSYVNKSIPVYVPCGSLEAYQNAEGWNEFTNIIGMCPGEVSVTVNSAEGGTVTGAGYYDGGDICVLAATPNPGFVFEQWAENGEVLSTDPSYSFRVTSDRALEAYFAEFDNHWTPESGQYEDNMTFTCVVELDGVEQRTTTLEVGAFCDEECRGSQCATYFPPTDRYIIQMMVFGESNDVISFRLYDHQQQQELQLAPPMPVTFTTNGYGSLSEPYVLNFTSAITHTQALSSGWNWWSTYVELENNDGLGQLENSIGNSGIIIKSRNSGYVEAYEYNGETTWFGTLNAINNEQMYKIRTSAACNATIVGYATMPSNHPISINNGWNWIGFPCGQNVSVDVAMSGFMPENNDIIKGRNGYTTYYSDGNYNMWYGTLSTFEPGTGYMYRSNSSTQKTLVFQTGRGDAANANITPENNVFRPAEEDYADNMTLTAVVELGGEELRSEGYELAAFVGEECRGSVRLMYIEPIDRYIAFLTIFGEQEEDLHFRLTDGAVSNLSTDRLAYVADGIVGSLDNPFVVHFETMDVNESASKDVKVYPNPSEGIFNIEGQNIRKVEVFNAFGQPVYSEETESGFMKLDLTNRAAGIYLIRIVTNGGILNHQIIKK